MTSSELNRIVNELAGYCPALKPTLVWNTILDESIATAPLHTFGDEGAARGAYALAVKAGLHLWNESLDRSHTLSQDILNETGSYWHGIMHRMEGDYGNAKYWFRQVGRHPAFETLRARAVKVWREAEEKPDMNEGNRLAVERLLGQSGWDPYGFIDLVEKHVRSGADEAMERLLMRLQREEFATLLAYSYANGSGGSHLELA